MKYIAGNQRISTDQGLLNPKDIKGDFKLLGYEPINAKNMQLKETAKLQKVILQNGMTFTGTPDTNLISSKHIPIPFKDIKIGDNVQIQIDEEALFGNTDMEGRAATLGIEPELYCSDEESAKLDEWELSKGTISSEELAKLAEEEKIFDKVKWKTRKVHVRLEENVPDFLWRCNRKTCHAYIQSLFGENAWFKSRRGRKTQYIPSDNLSFLQDIQFILANLGMSYLIKREEDSWTLSADFDLNKVAHKIIEIEEEEVEVYSFEVDNGETNWICNGIIVR